MTIRVFNVRLALWTLLVVVVFGPTIYAWHFYQLQRTAQAFLERADQLETEQDWLAAAGYLHRYLSLHSEENAVRIRMARAFDQGAKDWRKKGSAVNLYYHTLGLIPEEEQPALRRRLAELLLEMRRYSAAETEAVKLLAANDKDPQGRRLLALALYGQVQSGAAAVRSQGGAPIDRAFDSALQGNPGDIQLSTILAQIYRSEKQLFDEKQREMTRAEREKRADRLMDQMILANPASPEAYLARYSYRVQYRLSGAEEDLQLALKYGPDNVGVLLTAAERARRIGRERSNTTSSEEARTHCEHVLQIAPDKERGYLLLGDLNWELGDRSQAVETWRRGLKKANTGSVLLHLCLAGALVTLGQAEEAGAMLNALDGIIAGGGHLLTPGDRAVLECSRDFVRAKWWLLKGDFAKALPLLRRVAAQGTSPADTAQSLEAWMLLGRIWSSQNEWDQAATAYGQAAMLQPRSAALRLAAARAWAGAGRYDVAIRCGEQALAIDDAAESQLFLADVHYRQQLRLPQKQRDWQPFRQALAEAAAAAEKESLSNPWRLSVLQAGALLAGALQKSPDKARHEAAELLRTAENENPTSAALLQVLALAFERSGCSADADRVLAKLDKLPDQAFSALSCRVKLCMLRKQYAEARDFLRTGLEKFPSRRFAIRVALARVSAGEGKAEQAFQELVQLQAEFPHHPLLLRQLVEMAVDLGRSGDSQHWEEKLREREGPDGSSWRYYRARRLLAETADVKDRRFLEVERLVDELRTQRPSWPATHLLRGLVARRRGRIEQAIEAYENAIQLGERRINVYEQLIKLLYAERRFAEAGEYLGRLQEQVPFSENLSTMEISVAAQMGHLDQALAAASRGAESRPKDPMAQIWLGQVLLMSGQAEEAERAFQGAVKLAPADVRAYNALFTCYLLTHRPAIAAKILEELPKNVKMSAAERAFVLAQGYESIGNAGKENAEYLNKAGDQYEEAQRLAPDRAAVLGRRAAFLFNRHPAAAEKVLRRMLELDPRSASARRMLATLLALRGGEKEWQESQQLIETPELQTSVVEQRLQVALLVRRGGKENLLKARRILEKITADFKRSAPNDYLLLARLLEAEGKTTLARQQYLSVVSRAETEPAHLVRYVDFLLRHGAGDDAVPWLEKLQQRLPEDPAVVALRARWLHDQRRDSEIEPTVEALAEKLLGKLPENGQQRTAQEAKLSLELGNVYTVAEQHAAAERWYRRLVKLAPRQFAPLVASLGRQNRLGEAVAVCIEAGKTDRSARPAVILAGVLGASQPTAEEFRLAEPLLSQALASHPDDVDLLNGVAAVRVLQQRIDEAVELYRRMVALKPKNVMALNNLASLLAEQPRARQEAIVSIDEAIGVAGRLPSLLDTKGTILIHDGKAEKAIPLLKEATAGVDVDPRFLFHLGLACQRAGKPDEARVALQKARNGNLARQILTPAERRLLKELEQKLGL